MTRTVIGKPPKGPVNKAKTVIGKPALGDGDKPERIAKTMEREGIKKRLATAQLYDKSLTVDEPGSGRRPHGVVKGK